MSKQLANYNCLSLRPVAKVSIWVGSVVLHSITEHDTNEVCDILAQVDFLV